MKTVALVLLITCSTLLPKAYAQDYPSKPIRIFVAGTGGAGDFNLGIQTQQCRGRIGGERGPALGSTGSDVTQVSVFFDAEATAFAPSE